MTWCVEDPAGGKAVGPVGARACGFWHRCSVGPSGVLGGLSQVDCCILVVQLGGRCCVGSKAWLNHCVHTWATCAGILRKWVSIEGSCTTQHVLLYCLGACVCRSSRALYPGT